MASERQRIQDDLRGLVQGEVRCDDVFVQMYASDASIFEIEPAAVVRPLNRSEVVACLQYAAEHNLPVHPRGAGTGVAGGCLGRGIVLDFSYSMRRVISIDGETARVQPGVVHGVLNRQLSARGRIFGPDPASSQVTTMGSVLAVNRGGSHFLRYGAARDRVQSVQVVLSDGQTVELAQHTIPDIPPGAVAAKREVHLAKQVADLIRRHEATILAHKPKSLVNSSGYLLQDVIRSDGTVDLAKLIVGSEGTLGVITEATVMTDPLPAHRGVALLHFDRLEKAAKSVTELLKYNPAALDLIDRRLLSLARDYDPRYRQILPAESEAVLLIELDGDNLGDIRDQLKKIVHQMCRRKRVAFSATIALTTDEIELYEQLALRVLATLYRLMGNQRPLPFVEDIAVPPSRLADFLVSSQNVLKKHETTASLFAHAGHGQLHLRPFLDLANPDDVKKMQRIATDLYEHVIEVGGTISGEHGNGLSRSWYVRRQFPELYAIFRELKRVFDPTGILNPAKVTEPEPMQLTKSLRPVTTPPQKPATNENGTEPPATQTNATSLTSGPKSAKPAAADQVDTDHPPEASLELLLNWNENDVAIAARSCNGCGGCRSQSESLRMCPIFRFAPAEEASPRAKANLMRGLFTGHLKPSQLADDELKSIADLCVNCHQCRDECPANVDIPKLMIEYKAQYVATNGLPFADWLLSRTDVLADIGSRFSWLANRIIGSRRMRWLLQRITGIAQERKLPKIESRNFLTVARRRRLTKPTKGTEKKVLYFTDIYANWFDVQLSEAVINVFQHNGISVYVPTKQTQSGMSLISSGAIEKARVLAATNITILVEAIRQGYHIVTAEPSAALCLTREYPNMLSGEDVELVSKNTSEACNYLWQLHLRGQLELDFKPLNTTVGYHTPCHTRAITADAPARKLLGLIPGLSVRKIEKGCSGMAGTYGLKRENYRNSLRAGWPLISAIREPQLAIGSTECSTCKMQMEQATTKPTVHPIKLMALSYGLMPEIQAKLTTPGEELYVT